MTREKNARNVQILVDSYVHVYYRLMLECGVDM